MASMQESVTAELAEPRLQTDTLLDAAGEMPVELADYRPGPFVAIREAWSYRRVARTVLLAVFIQNIMRFRLGPFWLILQTFMALVGFTLIFGGGIFTVKVPNGMPYFLFMMVGMMGWQLFLQTLMMSTRGFQRVKILKNIHLPLLWVPIVGSALGLFRSLLYMVGYVLAVIYLWLSQGRLYVQLSPKLLLMSFAGLTLCLVFALGMGMWTAPLYAWAKDVRYVLRLVTPFWMFLTPVLYPIEHLHGGIRTLAELNPLSSPVEMIKVGLLGAGSVRIYAAIVSIALISTVFISGVWFITRFGHSLADTAGDRGDDDLDDF